MDFQSLYKDALVVRLEQNYRSTQTIVNASNAVIRQNKVRTDKTMFSKNDYGDPILIHESDDQDTEAEWIAKEIKIMNNQKVPLNDIAILYRTNTQSRAIEDKLLSFGIPYKVVGGTSFYDRKEIKDIMAYIRLYVNPKDEISFRRILSLLPGIGKKTQDEIVKEFKGAVDVMDALDQYNSKCKTRKAKDSIQMLMGLYNCWLHRNNDFVQMIDDMLNITGYKRELEQEDTEESRSRLENIAEFKNIAAEFQRGHPTGTLQEFIDKISLESTTEEGKEEIGKVSLMTLHGAKGLEFKYVFMPGCEEGILPHRNSMGTEDAIEEERRLFYVGMTRAMKQLYLTHAKRRYSYDGNANYNPVSRFVSDIPDEYIFMI
jgi:DNA helicase-2/ATP-dependent DNA helicase PcrA